MSYLIPTDEQINTALKNVLKKYRIINSQYRLKQLVTKELSTKKEKKAFLLLGFMHHQ